MPQTFRIGDNPIAQWRALRRLGALGNYRHGKDGCVNPDYIDPRQNKVLAEAQDAPRVAALDSLRVLCNRFRFTSYPKISASEWSLAIMECKLLPCWSVDVRRILHQSNHMLHIPMMHALHKLLMDKMKSERDGANMPRFVPNPSPPHPNSDWLNQRVTFFIVDPDAVPWGTIAVSNPRLPAFVFEKS